MKKLVKSIAIGIVVILCLGLGTVALMNSRNGSDVVNNERAIPPLDASASTETETATFALG